MGYRLEELTWLQAEDALRETKMVIIPTGSIEQHGPHLPLGTDYFIAREIANRVGEISPVVVVPAIPIGFADYHADFPGTLSVSQETLGRLYREICSYLVKYGVTHILFINGHGGNLGVIKTVMSSLRDQDVLAAEISWYLMSGILDRRWTLIGHGDFVETSLVLAINEGIVDLSKAKTPIRKNLSDNLILFDNDECRFRNTPIHVSLRTKDYTDTGDMIEYGHSPDVDHSVPPTEATAEMGKEIIEALTRHIAEFITEFKSVTLPSRDSLYHRGKEVTKGR